MNTSNKVAADLPDVEKLLSSSSSLPSLPSVVIKIIDASKNPDVSQADVAEILRVDPALSARLLKIANSSMYARRRQITNLREALSVLGLDAALTIALSFCLIKSFGDSDAEASFDAFWRRSILSATIARYIGVKLNLSYLEDYFLASLLQDLGILIIDCSKMFSFPEECTTHHEARISFEKEMIGLDHSDVGAWYLKKWELPEKIYEAVLCSHVAYEDELASDENSRFNQYIGLAGKLVDVWLLDDREKAVEENYILVNRLLGIDREEFNQFIEDISNMIPEMSSLFEICLMDDDCRDKIINEARDILMERNLGLIQQFDEHRREIQSLAERTRGIEEEASKDHLTSVYNRKRFEQMLESKFRDASENREPLTVAFIDIDDFKPVNDEYGHLAGDKVLQELAGFFTRSLRDTDVVARYGGDEFLLMLPKTGSEVAGKLMQRLMNEHGSAPAVTYEGNKLKIKFSAGVATHVDKTSFDNIQGLISAADIALYKAKKSGKNNVMCY